MGAYENPPVIPTPDYAEIMQRSFWNGYNQMQKVFQQKKQAEAAEKAEKMQVADNVIKFSNSAANINAGSLTANLQTKASAVTDDYAKLMDRYYNKKDIDIDDFNRQRIALTGQIGELSNLGKTLVGYEKELGGLKLSRYQKNTTQFALLDAWKKGAVDFNFRKSGGVDLIYNYNGTAQEMPLEALNDENTWEANEIYDPSADLANDIKLINQKVKSDDFRNDQEKRDFISNNSAISKYDTETLGSIYNDTFLATQEVDIANDPIMLKILNDKKISAEDQRQFLDNAKNGWFDNFLLSAKDNNGKSVDINTTDIFSAYTKNKLADDVMAKSNVVQPVPQKAIKPGKPTPGASIALDLYKNVLSKSKSFYDVANASVASGFDKASENEKESIAKDVKSLVSGYGFEFVEPSPKKDKDGNEYIPWKGNWEFKDISNPSRKIVVEPGQKINDVIKDIMFAKGATFDQVQETINQINSFTEEGSKKQFKAETPSYVAEFAATTGGLQKPKLPTKK